MTDSFIPFNNPFIAGKELYYIARAVLDGHLSGNGQYTNLCQQWLQEHLKTPKALLTHSCTGALEMAAILCDVQPGDEIIMPSFTFVSTANAFVLRGGVPVFIDIRPDNLNMNESLIESAITEKTRIIVPVHYAGVGCNMKTIMNIAHDHGLMVVEDAAQGLLSCYQDQFLGAIGDLGCLSFHETKNIISGEGGALLINHPELSERAEVIWEKGTNRNQFYRGHVDKYTWVDIGSSFLPGELTAAFLFAQLEEAEKIIARRRAIFRQYLEGLQFLSERGQLQLPYTDPACTCNGHIFYLLTSSQAERDALIAHLLTLQIMAVFHYVPLHDSPAGKRYGRSACDMPVTNDISNRLLRLPIYYEMTENTVNRVIRAVEAFYRNR